MNIISIRSSSKAYYILKTKPNQTKNHQAWWFSFSLYYSSTIRAAIIKGLSALLLETTTPGVYNSAVKIHSRMKLVMQGSSYLSPNVRKLYLYIFEVILKHSQLFKQSDYITDW